MTTPDDALSLSLQRCTLESIAFPVESIEQQGARGVVEHEQWGRDGAELTDTGRKAYRGKITALFLRGLSGWPDSLYETDYPAVIDLLATRGDRDLRLAHPLLGTFPVRVPSWAPRVVAGVRSGAYLDFEWIEQRASVTGVVATLLPATDVGQTLDVAAAAADAALAPLGILGGLARAATTVRTAVGRALAPVGEVQGAISQMRGTIAQATRMISLQALTGTTRALVHAARASVAQCKGALARVEAQATAPAGLPRTITAPRRMTVAEFAAWVYRDPRKAGQLRVVNGLASDTIAAGQTLVVP
ncbi:MAG: DNA circularization N-terminal domain-containing protein [Deltaproteobacteria bacterium]|nr:DNA circularization N-terminal domain-containing protein [Myxococcales bacterium]MDP3217698.1 DNA circularization N-terminal domain-containing protein [Deltaproteobacteria bacterium]